MYGNIFYNLIMRIDKLLMQLGFGSRNQIKKLIRSQQVKVDGVSMTNASLNVDPQIHELRVSGKVVEAQIERYFILNKPKGVVSAVSDKVHKTVIDCLRPDDRDDRLYPVGRLDRDTEGLVLLTTNGPLGFRLLHPQHHVDKTYFVKVNGLLTEEDVIAFKEGIVFHSGYKCKEAELKILSQSNQESRAEVTISEGKFHQVKKMFLARGVKVTYLKRIAFADIHLENELETGEYRTLTSDEKTILKKFFD